MPDSPNKKVQFSFSAKADTAAAKKNLEDLTQTALTLDEALDHLKQTAVDTYNEINRTVGRGSIQNFGQLQQIQASYPTQAAFQSANPEVADLLREILTVLNQMAQQQTSHAQKQQQAQNNATQNGAKPGQPGAYDPADANARSYYVDKNGRLRNGRGEFVERKQSFADQLYNNALGGRSLTSLGAFASGNPAALGNLLASTVGEALFRQVRAIRSYNALVAKVGTVVPGTPVPGGIGPTIPEGLDLSASGAVTTPPPTSGLLGRLAGILASPVGLGGMALTAVLGAAALYGNKGDAKNNTDEQALRANFSGAMDGRIGGGSAADRAMWDVINTGTHGFRFDIAKSMQTAESLGHQGVQLKDMRAALTATMAMARETGLDPTQISGLVGQRMAVGGDSISSVTKQFSELVTVAGKTNVPLTKMIDSLTTLQQATGGAAINMIGLAAVQGILGNGMNAGSVVAPLSSAEGVTSIADAQFLGVSLPQFNAMQNHPDQLMTNVAKLAQRLTKGRDTAQNEASLITLLGQGGLNLVDFGQNPQQANKLASLLIGGTNFSAQASHLEKQIQGQSPQSWEDAMKSYGQSEVDWLSRLNQEMSVLERTAGEGFDHVVSAVKDTTKGVDFLKNPLGSLVTIAGNIAGGIVNGVGDILEGIFGKGPGGFDAGNHPTGNGSTPESIGQRMQAKYTWNGGKGHISIPDIANGDMYNAYKQDVMIALTAQQQTGVSAGMLLAQYAQSNHMGTTNMDTPLGFTGAIVKDLAHNKKYGAQINRYFSRDYNAASEGSVLTGRAMVDKWAYEHNGHNWANALAFDVAGADSHYGADALLAGKSVDVSIKGEVTLKYPDGTPAGKGQVSGSARGKTNPNRAPKASRHPGPHQRG